MRGARLLVLLGGLWPVSARAADASIAVEAPAGGCPDRAGLTSGLEARLPGVTRARGAREPAQRYRLEIERGPGSAAVALRLREGGGALVLERRLAVPGSGPSAEACRALAEAAAMVVVRYLREIGYRSPTPVLPPDAPRVPDEPARPAEPRAGGAGSEAPSPPAAPSPTPPPAPAGAAVPSPAASPSPATGAAGGRTAASPAAPPGPRASGRALDAVAVAPVARASTGSTWAAPRSVLLLGAGGGARLGLGGGGTSTSQIPARSEVLLGLQGSHGWLGAEIAGGASTETGVAVPGSAGADLRLRAFPMRAALGIPLPLLGGVILPAAGVSVDLLRFRARGLIDARSGTRVEPAAELGLAYRAAGRRLFVRGSLWGGFSLAPRDFDAGGAEPVLRTPAAYLRVAVEGGLALWKN